MGLLAILIDRIYNDDVTVTDRCIKSMLATVKEQIAQEIQTEFDIPTLGVSRRV